MILTMDECDIEIYYIISFHKDHYFKRGDQRENPTILYFQNMDSELKTIETTENMKEAARLSKEDADAIRELFDQLIVGKYSYSVERRVSLDFIDLNIDSIITEQMKVTDRISVNLLLDKPKLIESWDDMRELNTSDTHEVKVDVHSGWVEYRKDILKDREGLGPLNQSCGQYLSTHTFYGMTYKESTKYLQHAGFNVEVANWDAIDTVSKHNTEPTTKVLVCGPASQGFSFIAKEMHTNLIPISDISDFIIKPLEPRFPNLLTITPEIYSKNMEEQPKPSRQDFKNIVNRKKKR